MEFEKQPSPGNPGDLWKILNFFNGWFIETQSIYCWDNTDFITGYVEQTFAEPEEYPETLNQELENQSSDHMHFAGTVPLKKIQAGLSLHKAPEFTSGTWCFDTPGTVNRNQVSA